MKTANGEQTLLDLEPKHDFLVALDSDGTVFDSMRIKHLECFAPLTIQFWDLQPIEEIVLKTINTINLQSQWRGINRWPSLIKIFDSLAGNSELKRLGFPIPRLSALRQFIHSGHSLNSCGLRSFAASNPNQEIELAIRWSDALDDAFIKRLPDFQPFHSARACLRNLYENVDLIVVSGTREQILQKEWQRAGLFPLVQAIAGQETGSKTQILSWAINRKYHPENVLMVGDTPGDLQAAQNVGVLFYPVFPGGEDVSWESLNQDLEGFLGEKSRFKEKIGNLCMEFCQVFQSG